MQDATELFCQGAAVAMIRLTQSQVAVPQQ